MVAPCLVKKVEDCAKTIPYIKHVVHMGTSLSTALASSTSPMLQTFPSSFEPFGVSRALLRNLINTSEDPKLVDQHTSFYALI
jgi:hypothetical protein